MFDRRGQSDDIPEVQARRGDLWEGESMLVNLLLWALFGLIAGVAAKFISKEQTRTDPMGILLTIVLGIAGAVVGGWLSSTLFQWDVNAFSLPGFAVAVVGALLILFVYHMLMASRKAL
jgi:uncharacterized membrane protein YeaQ/YmgE (transglycosylase-associated protein family)